MANSKRSKRNFQAPRQENQPAKQDNIKRLMSEIEEKAQKNLQKDERVQTKIQEYEQLIEELEQEYLRKQEKLQAEYAEKLSALRDEPHPSRWQPPPALGL